MTSRLVSAIIPTYNRGDLICRAVDSVLGQTYPEVEAVVVDDGSTDDTSAVMARYAGDSRVRYIKVENGGVSRARNIALAAARGAYLAFLDSDDYWLPWKIELQVKCLERVPEAGMIWTDYMAVSEQGEIVQHRYLRQAYTTYATLEEEGLALFGPPKRLTPQELDIPGVSEAVNLYSGDIFSQMVLGNVVHTPTTLVRRERLERVKGFREDLLVTGEDYDFHLRTCREGPVAFADVESIGYTVGRADRLTAPALAAQLAQNAIRTIEPVLKDSAAQIKLPRGAVARMLGETYAWAASKLLESGRVSEARSHAWRSIRIHPYRREAYVIFAASLVPRPLQGAFRSVYRRLKGLAAGRT